VIHVALRGMARRKLRTALTAIAIVLGVALITGTYVLTDSIKGAFGGIFTSVYRGTDATVTGKSAFNLSDNGTTTAPPFDQSLLPKVRKLPDVADAVGGVGGLAHLIINGKVVHFGGAPNLGFSVDPKRPELNTLTLIDGKWPGANQVVIDQATALGVEILRCPFDHCVDILQGSNFLVMHSFEHRPPFAADVSSRRKPFTVQGSDGCKPLLLHFV